MIETTSSVITRDGAEDIPVLSIQATFLTALAILYARNIPIVNSIVRVQIDGKESQHHIYTLGSVRSFLYFPNRQAGRSEIVDNPSPEQKVTPAFYLKSWSTYKETSSEYTLHSSDHNLYHSEFAKVNLIWEIFVYTTSHPSFNRRAKDVNLDTGAAFEGVDGPAQSKMAFKLDRIHFEDLNYHGLLSNDGEGQMPNLASLYTRATKIANKYKLNNKCQFVRKGAPSNECTFGESLVLSTGKSLMLRLQLVTGSTCNSRY